MSKDKNIGQESNENWDEQNDQSSSDRLNQPNPERYQDANLGQGNGSRKDQNDRSSESDRSSDTEKTKHGSSFNEETGTAEGYGSSQRSEPRQSVGPLDADLAELPSHKRSSGNQTGPGLG